MLQEALGKAIELTGNKSPSEKEVADMLAENAEAYGFPTIMSPVVHDTFATNVCTFMSQNFQTILPVSLFTFLMYKQAFVFRITQIGSGTIALTQQLCVCEQITLARFQAYWRLSYLLMWTG
jgi:hypothetical protein